MNHEFDFIKNKKKEGGFFFFFNILLYSTNEYEN